MIRGNVAISVVWMPDDEFLLLGDEAVCCFEQKGIDGLIIAQKEGYIDFELIHIKNGMYLHILLEKIKQKFYCYITHEEYKKIKPLALNRNDLKRGREKNENRTT